MGHFSFYNFIILFQSSSLHLHSPFLHITYLQHPYSLLAAASKAILHLDPNPFYDFHFSTLSLSHLSSYILSPPQTPPPGNSLDTDYSAVPLSSRCLITAISISIPPLPANLALDVSDPRVIFCADVAIKLLLRSEVSHYLEFKAVDDNLIYDGEKCCLISVLDSRSSIFKDKGLSLFEKTKVGRFFKLVTALASHLTWDADLQVSEDDLETSFFEFLLNFELPKRIVGYAISSPFVIWLMLF